MSANADSVRFKLARKVHVWAYLEKNISFLEILFLQKMAYGLGQYIFYIKFLVVSDLEALFE